MTCASSSDCAVDQFCGTECFEETCVGPSHICQPCSACADDSFAVDSCVETCAAIPTLLSSPSQSLNAAGINQVAVNPAEDVTNSDKWTYDVSRLQHANFIGCTTMCETVPKVASAGACATISTAGFTCTAVTEGFGGPACLSAVMFLCKAFFSAGGRVFGEVPCKNIL